MPSTPTLPSAGALAILTIPAAAADVAAVLRDGWRLEGVLHPVAGERDTNFLLEAPSGRYLVKVTHPLEPREAVEAQLAVLEHLQAYDVTLPVQRPLPADHGALLIPYPPDPRRLVRVVHYLDGLLSRDSPWHDQLAHEIGALAGRLDQALAGFTHPGCTQDLLWDLRRAPELNSLLRYLSDDPIESIVRATLIRYSSCAPMLAACPVQAIHNDLNPSNLLIGADGRHLCGIIDFGDMIMAPAIMELTVACAYLTAATDLIDAIGNCAAAYLAWRPLPKAAMQQLPDLIATRWAMTILITEWRAQLHPENAAYILRNNPASRHGLSLMDETGRARLGARLQELTA